MKKKSGNITTLFAAAILLLSLFTTNAQTTTSELLNELDRVVESKGRYSSAKEERMEKLKELAAFTVDLQQRYSTYGELFDEYKSYNTDSAYVYAMRKMELALELNMDDKICDALLNEADAVMLNGMYLETVNMLSRLNESDVPDYLFPYYYHILKTTYEYLSEYSIGEEDREGYAALGELYRDKLIEALSQDSVDHLVVLCDKLIDEERFDEARLLLCGQIEKLEPGNHNMAFLSLMMSEVCAHEGDSDGEKRNLALSSISDLTSGVREYVSLQRLAIVLFEEGDVNRAYSYLKCSLEDANACGARMRTIEVGDVFPIINEAYMEKNRQNRRNLSVGLLAVSILALLLILLISTLFVQNRKVREARQSLGKANDEMKQLNLELLESNRRLNDANAELQRINAKLRETSTVKEEYIGQYMNLCSAYIGKIEQYRKRIYKLALTQNLSKVTEALRSTRHIDKELSEFYSNFDEAFLSLFPSFVSDFNSLLREGEEIVPKHHGELNTDLRIFALIRLGITDSVKIAQFLRYSTTTIYNYRTRIRNKARTDRADLEKRVMEIGSSISQGRMQ